MKIFFVILLWYPSISRASAVAEGEEEMYEIRSSFLSKYTCYIEVKKKDIPKSAFLVGVCCEKFIKKNCSQFHHRKTLSYALYGFNLHEVDLSKNLFFRQAVIFQLREELEMTNSLYARLLKSIILRLLKG